MIELQVGKKKVELPEKLTISQYKELRKVDDFMKNPIEFIKSISGLSDEEVRYSDKKQMDFVLRYMINHYLGDQDSTLRPSFEFKGIKYGLMSEMSSLNFGGWVDLEFMTTDGVEKNMEKIMSLMYRPIVKETKKGFELEPYDHKDMENRSELFLELPVEYFWGVSSFFFNLVKAYTENTKDSLEYQRTKRTALTRLNKMNPRNLLSKLRHVFIGIV